MSTPTWGLDPKSRRITVYYEGTSTIREGMPVCYNYDTTDNWLGVASVDFTTTASSVTESGTTAEGSQNEGKFIRVEDPVTANLEFFAGVVAGADHDGEAGPRAIDIYVPNGAIVPVRTDASTTVGVTVLGIANGSTLCASGGRPVAIAMETDDLSTDNGAILAILDPSIFGLYQKGVGSGQQFNGLTGAVANTMQNVFAATSGTACGLLVHTTASGAVATSQNAWSVLAYLSVSGGSTGTGYSRASLSQLVLTGTYNNGGLCMYGAHVQVGGAPTLTHVQRVAGLCVEYGTTIPTTGDADVMLLYANPSGGDLNSYVHMWGDGEKADFIWKFSGCGGLSTSTLIKKMGTGGMWTNTGAWIQIPIDVSGDTYYIPAGALLSEA